MSLARFRTRMLALAALMPQPTDKDAVTMAEDRVFDSRLDPLQFGNDPEVGGEIPAITVYTDEDTAVLLNKSANGGPFLRTVTLRVEIVVGTFDTEVIDEQKQIVFGLPYSTPELEAKLDLFEQQVRWALFNQITRPASTAFMKFVVQFDEVTSIPDRDESGNNRMASRRMLFKLRINDDCPPTFVTADNLPGIVPLTEADFPFAPWLAPMFMRMQALPSYRDVIQAAAGTGAPSILLPVLKRLGWSIDAIDPADPNLLAQQGKTHGPDGRIEVGGIWSIKE